MPTAKNFKAIKDTFFEIISLSNRRYRFAAFVIILLLLFIIPVQILGKAPNLSICQKILGNYCPSIGITRGVSSILKGDLNSAWNYNPLSFLVLIVMIWIIVCDFIKIRNKK